MSHNIPFEMQMEIVKRLPVKSLFQFRSVSKSWKSMIDSSRFIADYNAFESRPERLFIEYEDNPYYWYNFDFDRKYVCVVDDDIFPQHKFATTLPMAKSFGHLKQLILVGSSQGLLCFLGEYRHDHSYWEMAFIWNPAIRKSIAIDVPLSFEIFTTSLGFGVCPNTNEPMIVKLNNYDEISRPVEVFTLSSKVWRRSRSNLPRKSISFLPSQVAIGGFIYWKTLDGHIVSFHMTTEEFVEMYLPSRLANLHAYHLSICNLRGSLTVLEHYMEDEKRVDAVWIMEHGVPKSFTKLYTITTPNECITKVLGFRKNGEVIFEAKTDEGGKPAVLKVYEPRSEHIKDLGIYGDYATFSMSSYKETLLLLDQVDNQRIKIKMECDQI